MDCEFENDFSPSPILSNAATPSFNKQVDDTVSVASEFCRFYYDMLERKPHKIGQMYLENSVLLWDGNPGVTNEGIQKFFDQLPSLTFNLSSMDCQQINSAAVGSMKSYLIKVSGQVRASGAGTVKPFTQQIILTVNKDKWRIASDIFRTQQ